jgi:hypothetical protein
MTANGSVALSSLETAGDASLSHLPTLKRQAAMFVSVKFDGGCHRLDLLNNTVRHGGTHPMVVK